MTTQSIRSNGEISQADHSASTWGAIRYISTRLLAISLTLLAGVFLCVVIANHTGMLDKAVKDDISRRIVTIRNEGQYQGSLLDLRQEMERAAGLNLPFIPKYLRYSIKALQMDWGNVRDWFNFSLWIDTPQGQVKTLDSRQIVLHRLPNTLLLSGVAFLLLMLFGIPIALYLSRHEDSWLDRLVGALSPFSSVPSWVIGILLVFFFAVQLKLLPAGKMFGGIPPQTGWQTVRVVALHMVLPVSAIVLSQLFQLVYTWRTYFIIYSSEEYVTLAKAMGLHQKSIDYHHVLRPALPFIVTNLTLTLVGFWQMTAALEYFFQWPGIGALFMNAQPNFRSESMYMGEMSIVINIIVLFAYLLAVCVFMLDVLYILFDPRIRLQSPQNISLRSFRLNRLSGLFSARHIRNRGFKNAQTRRQSSRERKTSPVTSLKMFYLDSRESIQRFFRKMSRVPTAIAGVIMTLLLVILSILVVIFIPYDPVGREWSGSGFSATPLKARKAQPLWINVFRADKLPETIVVTSRDETAVIRDGEQVEDFTQVGYDLSFDYPYSSFPSEVAIYFSSKYDEKLPFVNLTWLTPDGREIKLRNTTLPSAQFTYPIEKSVTTSRLLSANPKLKDWVVASGSQATPSYMLLFADPTSKTPSVISGKYTLRIDGVFFEPGGELEVQLVVFGLAEGWGGTDYLRRDLYVPLLWGLPFALLIGVLGSIFTSMVSLLLAAISAWHGGWIDGMIQRVTEANLLLPVMFIGVLLFSYYQISLWVVIGLIILSNILGSSTKTFRAAFLQEKEAGYIEAAKAYGASGWRIIWRYMVRRVLPMIIPQVVMFIPGFIFLEATLAIFSISDPRFPTWGQMIYSGLRHGALFNSRLWVLQPITLMLITGLAFVLLSFGLERMRTEQSD